MMKPCDRSQRSRPIHFLVSLFRSLLPPCTNVLTHKGAKSTHPGPLNSALLGKGGSQGSFESHLPVLKSGAKLQFYWGYR